MLRHTDTIEDKKILVSGSSGFLGSRLCQRLLSNGNSVFGIDYNETSPIANRALNDHAKFTFSKVDISKAGEVRPVFENNSFDMIFHLAAIANPRACKENFDTAFDINVVGTKNVLQYSPVSSRLIFMSSASVYGEPLWLPLDESHPRNGTDPYSVTKIMGEDLCMNSSRNYDRAISIVRNFNTFGEGQLEDYIIPTIIKKAKSHRIEIWNGTPVRDLTYIDNTLDALVLIATKDTARSSIYNIGSGKGVQIAKLAAMIRDMVDESIEIKDLQKAVLGSPSLIANNTKLKNLGWSERISLHEGLSKTIEWFKSIEA